MKMIQNLRLSDIGMLADDLTGACDVAARFSPKSGPVSVLARGRFEPADHSAGLEVINAQSRRLSRDDCREVIGGLAASLRARPVVFVKIDTALRGPVGALLEALSAAIGPRRFVVAPAMPSIGRITAGGVQFDRGVPIHRTSHADDPGWPVACSDVAEIIRGTGQCEFEVFDAAGEDDLAAIVAEALSRPPVALVGSLGLAEALARRLPAGMATIPDVPASRRPMIVCGSTYQAARRQLAAAVARTGAGQVVVDPVAWTGRFPPTDGPLLVSLAQRGEPALDCDEAMDRFMKAVSQIMELHKPDGLGIIGGETAFALLDRLKGRRLSVMGRAEEVVSLGAMVDGTLAGRPMATKGGSVGTDAAVVAMLDYLTNPRGVLC